ncbi:hypothetical protein L596_016291 [Steinernema carpocapsae]|uniref:3-hydroxy-3-methylglutaryl-coenzyme A reductase n=1 Tax=Steinernema carpocapsae TaxID=34508 RepID=A0A4U5NI65_STECR|nr:hypothetical protein L596_016291 [Steinernema carpocapsae]
MIPTEELLPKLKNEVSSFLHELNCHSEAHVDKFVSKIAKIVGIELTEDEDKAESKHPMDEASDESILELLEAQKLKHRLLEEQISSKERAVAIRRAFIAKQSGGDLGDLPYKDYDYEKIYKTCCENPIGYVPIPVGCAGPLTVDKNTFFVPMATTEGALIGSVNRGCKAIQQSREGGVKATVYGDKMARAPMVSFDSVDRAEEFYEYMKDEKTFQLCKKEFETTTRFGKLVKIEAVSDCTDVILRFCATTGDAMGMNIVTKGVEHVLDYLKVKFPDMDVVVSSNFCTDKKTSHVNLMEGRGKSVKAWCTIPKEVVKSVLNTSVEKMVAVSILKCQKGSTMAGSVGGNNCHAANMVAAMFIVLGQDPAQVVESSMCMTSLKESPEGDLIVSCRMPCMEVGTVGGGTSLKAQKAALEMLKCAGGHLTEYAGNAKQLAKIICATVMAGEISLLASLHTGMLAKSHMKLNRSKVNFEEPVKPQPAVSTSQISATLRLERTSAKDPSRKDVLEIKANQCNHML